MIILKRMINRLAKEIDAITFVNPSHRLMAHGIRGLEPLVQAVNRLADRHGQLHAMTSKKIKPANVGVEEEKNILAAVISELPQGILVCNADGKIFLFNRLAIKYLDIRGSQAVGSNLISAERMVLGKSVSALIDKHLIEHALDEINERLKRKLSNVVSHFVIDGKENHIIGAEARPILNRLGQFSGFVLLFQDITKQREADNRMDALLQELTKSARSPLASIRAASEAMLEYPDIDSTSLQQFKEIIHKESITISNILSKMAGDYSVILQKQRTMVPMSVSDLMDTIKRRAKDRLGIVVEGEKPSEKLWVRVDSYSIIVAILFVLNQLKNESGHWHYGSRLKKHEKFVHLDFVWQGQPIRANVLRRMHEEHLIFEGEKSPLSLDEVLDHHETAVLSFGCEGSPNQSCFRFILPTQKGETPDIIEPITFIPEIHAELFNPELMSQPGQNPELDNRLLTELTYTVLIRTISEAKSIEQIMDKHSQLPRLLFSMINSGANIRSVTWLITTFSDTILKKIIGFAIDEFGPPPTRFAIITLGSEGRKEQTLKTDQDNAIIYEDVREDVGEDPGKKSKISEQEVKSYFLKFGERMCTWLDQIGYHLCTGRIMASNPKWCQPLSIWKRNFNDWIHAARPEDLLHSSIFFDFRFGGGNADLVENLRDYLFKSLEVWPGFLRHMTENAVYFKPPIGFFGNFQVESGGKHPNCLDIKRAMTAIVDYARIYALDNGIQETNTQDRLYQLYLKKILSPKAYREIEQAFNFVMQIRITHQINAIIVKGLEPDNHINPKKLSIMEQKMLKEVFKRIEKMQKQICMEFTGASESPIE
jgi:CBS domain-containing protein